MDIKKYILEIVKDENTKNWYLANCNTLISNLFKMFITKGAYNQLKSTYNLFVDR